MLRTRGPLENKWASYLDFPTKKNFHRYNDGSF